MNKKTLKFIFINLMLLAIIIIPAFSLAQNTNPSSTAPNTNLSVPAGGIFPGCSDPVNGCGFNDLLNLVNSFVKFVLFSLALPIAAIMFCYAGIVLLFAGGSTEKVGKAKKIFWNVLLGLVIAAAAWLIVELILTILGYQGSWIGF